MINQGKREPYNYIKKGNKHEINPKEQLKLFSL